MRYLGGKSRIAKALAARIREIVPDAKGYWDPFCGGLSMSVALSAYAPVIASDACAPLIALYQAVRDGWVPPSEVSRETWQAAKELPDTHPMKAFCGFGCSFSGMWFHGYAGEARRRVAHGREMNDDAPRACGKALIRNTARVAPVLSDWFDVAPSDTESHVLYLDPPYAGTQGYEGAPTFDSDRFIGRVVRWSRHAHVFVSEYAFPVGREVFTRQSTQGVAQKERTERLFYIAKGSL